MKDESSKLRVLVVSTSFPVSEISSSGIFVKRLVDGLGKLINPEVLIPGGVERIHLDTSYQVRGFRYAPKSWQLLAHQPGGVPVALKNQPVLWLVLPIFFISMFLSILSSIKKVQIVHANWSATGLIAGVAGRMFGVPVCTTFRGEDVKNLRESLTRRIVLGITVRVNTKLVTVSESMRIELESRFPSQREKFCCIPNGVGDELLLLERNEMSKKLKLLCVGSLISRKRIKDVIAAVNQLGENVSLTIVGDGVERGMLESMVNKFSLQHRVSFEGEHPPILVKELLKSHDVLVLSSEYEGRPNVVLEAMAAGLAIVTSNLPGVRELITHGEEGLIYEVGDVEALKNHVLKLLGSSTLGQELGNNARNKILNENLTWSATAARYLSIYKSMCKDRVCVD